MNETLTPNQRQFSLTIHFYSYLKGDQICDISPKRIKVEVDDLGWSMKNGQKTIEYDSKSNWGKITARVEKEVRSIVHPSELVKKVEVSSAWTDTFIGEMTLN